MNNIVILIISGIAYSKADNLESETYRTEQHLDIVYVMGRQSIGPLLLGSAGHQSRQRNGAAAYEHKIHTSHTIFDNWKNA